MKKQEKLSYTIIGILMVIILAIVGLTEGWIRWVAIGAGFIVAITGFIIRRKDKKG